MGFHLVGDYERLTWETFWIVKPPISMVLSVLKLPRSKGLEDKGLSRDGYKTQLQPQ